MPPPACAESVDVAVECTSPVSDKMFTFRKTTSLESRPVPAADRTFSFRAPAELAERMEKVRAALDRIRAREEVRGGPDDSWKMDVSEWVFHEFGMAVLRALDAEPELKGQSQLTRFVVEAFASAAEMVERGIEEMPALKEFDRQDVNGPAERAALGRLAAEAWKDD